MSTKKSAWQECELKDIFTIVTGKTPSKKIDNYFGGNIPFVKPPDLDKNLFIDLTEDTLTENGFQKSVQLPKNTVLVSCIGNLGKKGILLREGSCNQQINAILPNKIIYYKYTYYYINIIKEWMEINSSATTVKILNKSTFEKAPFKYPPLEEQKLIVEKIESEFQKIDNALNKLNIIKEQIKQYKQSVLKYAFDENNSFAKGRNYEPYEWEERALKEVGTIIGGGTPDTTNENYWNGDILWVTPTDITKLNSIYLSTTNRKITKLGLENSSAKIIKKYSLIICTRATIGNSCINTNDVTTNQGIKSIIPNKDYNVLFLHYLINNNTDKLIANSSGSTFKEIAKSKLENLVFKFPNIELQKTIADNIQNIFDKIDNIENNINENIDKLNVLKQAVLKNAFEGKLI